jgi:hypothetical protein
LSLIKDTRKRVRDRIEQREVVDRAIVADRPDRNAGCCELAAIGLALLAQHIVLVDPHAVLTFEKEGYPCFQARAAMSLVGQSRRMRPACFRSECPLLPGSDS